MRSCIHQGGRQEAEMPLVLKMKLQSSLMWDWQSTQSEAYHCGCHLPLVWEPSFD